MGKGCRVYDQRPEPCRTFYCGYLIWGAVPDHWFPARAKIVVVSELGFRVNFYVDASQPGRWREKPWYDDIKALAVRAIADGGRCRRRRAAGSLPSSPIATSIWAASRLTKR